MNADATGFAAALLLGVFGSVHCAGMCSGIACAFSLSLPASVRDSRLRTLGFVAACNAGRILGYAFAGALAGLLGSLIASPFDPALARSVGVGIGASFMVALGLYLAGWWRGLALLERAGAKVWKRLQPLTRALLPIDSLPKALAAGALWGWLPCGLVYSALAFSLTTGDPLHGAALMAVFGLGTLPVLLGFGLLGRWLGEMSVGPLARGAAGVFIAGAGVVTLLYGPLMHGAATLHGAAH